MDLISLKLLLVFIFISVVESSVRAMNITVDYTNLDNQKNKYSNDYINKVKNVVDSGVKSISSLLLIPKVNKKLVIKFCATNINIDLALSTTGYNSDFVIFPFIDEGLKTYNIDIDAIHCIKDKLTNRPIAGIMRFADNLDFGMTNWSPFYELRALRAIIRMMVFNYELIQGFIDNKGVKISLDKIIEKRLSSSNKFWIITPRVVATAQNYFNCTKITGVPLEDYFSPISNELSVNNDIPQLYWESRWMYSDIMTADKNNLKVISEITLALFEDSGWYKVNYYTGGLFRFGKKQGCNFLYNDCIIDDQVVFKNDFCNLGNSGFCSSNRLERGFCYIKITTNISSIPKQNRYFTDQSLAGHPLVDFCPVSAPLLNNTMFFKGSCQLGDTIHPIGMMDNIFITENSSFSSCFMSSLVSLGLRSNYSDYSNDQIYPYCYHVICDYKNESYDIFIDTFKKITVTKDSPSTQSIQGYKGSVETPKFSLICTNKNGVCSDALSCINNKVESNISYLDYIHYDSQVNDHQELTNGLTNNQYTNFNVILDPIDIRYNIDQIDIKIRTDNTISLKSVLINFCLQLSIILVLVII